MSDGVDTFDFHRRLLANETRTEGFRQAIVQTVRPGDVVADVGTGSGILAFFACQAGASKVYAIEPADVVEVARQVSIRNGFQDRIVFTHDFSSRTVLPEKVDVLLSDCDLRMIDAVIDARRRWLKEDGRLIPRSITCSIVPIETAENYRRADYWMSKRYDVDFSPFRPFIVNSVHALRIDQCSFLSAPAPLAKAVFAEAETADLRGEISFEVTNDGVLHGIAVWFMTEILGTTGGPGSKAIVRPDWGHAFLPVESAVPVVAGDLVSVSLHIRWVGGKDVWSWNTRVQDRSGHTRAAFTQSSFAGSPQSSLRLRKLAASHTPALNEDGELDRFVLGLMDGKAALGDIARQAVEKFPSRFDQLRDAVKHVGSLSERYSR